MAIRSTTLTATERITRKVQTLDFMRSHLIELNKMAARDKLDMLCYLIEMAIVEADTAIQDQKCLRSSNRQAIIDREAVGHDWPS